MTIILPEEPDAPDVSEINYHRFNTKEFIDADPLEILLTHHSRVDTDDGGFTRDDSPHIGTQVFRLIPQTDVMPLVQTPDGVQLQPGYVLLGEWNCDMRRWDTFTLNGIDFVIVSPIRPDFRDSDFVYERKADVARR